MQKPSTITEERFARLLAGRPFTDADNVRHHCPDCDFGRPALFCRTCHGVGTVDAAQLDAWQLRADAEARGESGLIVIGR